MIKPIRTGHEIKALHRVTWEDIYRDAIGLPPRETQDDLRRKVHGVFSNLSASVACALPDAVVVAIMEVLGHRCPDLKPEIPQRLAAIRLERDRKRGNLAKALKEVEKTLDLTKGQENGLLLRCLMNTIDRMHLNKPYCSTVSRSKCKFAVTLTRQYKLEERKIARVQRSEKGLKREQALMILKAERAADWFVS